MLELLQAILLGIVQGLTEFLPVSSSGHLFLGQYFMGLDQNRFGLAFDVAMHLGTLLAVVAFFWRDLLNIGFAFLQSLSPGTRDLSRPDQRMAYLILASTVPAAVIGFLLEDFFSTAVRNPWVVVATLVVVGALFIIAEAVGSQSQKASGMSFRGALGIGFAQAAALVPGVSRSGATITLGLFLGITRQEAARFSFLMSTPIIAGAGSLKLTEALSEGMDVYSMTLFVIGFVSSAVVGYLAIRFFIGFVAHHSLRAFAYYRFGLAAVTAAVLLVF